MNMRPVIFLMGPTAAGKTDLAIAIAQQQSNIEIISVDSALVYRGMDIGTAKPDPATLAQYPHHLVDIIEPTENYSAGAFCHDARRLIADIQSRGKIPLLVGGTMLYFNALQYGIADLPDADPAIRKKLDAEAEKSGWQALHHRLSEIDPTAAARIHENDPQRLQRALEVYEITGKTLTELTQDTDADFPYPMIKIILSPFDRKILHARIANRYHKMMVSGLIEEVKQLFKQPDCHEKLPAMRAVGYRQVWSSLEQMDNSAYDQEALVEKAIIATRQMAKRQLTWCRSQQDGVWFDSGPDLPVESVMQFLQEKL